MQQPWPIEQNRERSHRQLVVYLLIPPARYINYSAIPMQLIGCVYGHKGETTQRKQKQYYTYLKAISTRTGALIAYTALQPAVLQSKSIVVNSCVKDHISQSCMHMHAISCLKQDMHVRMQASIKTTFIATAFGLFQEFRIFCNEKNDSQISSYKKRYIADKQFPTLTRLVFKIRLNLNSTLFKKVRQKSF